MSFERKKRHTLYVPENKQEELLHILNSVPGCAIVYTRNRKRTREIAELLVNNGITATFYHAGLNNDVKRSTSKKLATGKPYYGSNQRFRNGYRQTRCTYRYPHRYARILLKPIFKKPDERGRDRKHMPVLLYAQSDKPPLNKRISDAISRTRIISGKVYEDINYYFQIYHGDGMGCNFAFNLDEFCRNFKHFPYKPTALFKDSDPCRIFRIYR